MPFFTIITITKSNPAGFQKTKQSIESQSFKDFEWVVIDGDVEPDNGIYDAMNKGLSRAKGRYLVFMNAGDVFANASVLQMIFDRHNNADIVYGDSIEGGYLKASKPHDQIARGLFTHHQSIYYKRSAIGDLQYDEAYPVAADYKFTAQLLKNGATAHYIPSPSSIFETGGLSQKNVKQGRLEQVKIREQLGLSAPWTPYRQYVAQTVKSISCPLYWFIKRLIHR
jgi:putative colanic acid biosynthesis glycosyltransferase